MPNIAIQLNAGQLPPNPCYTSEQERFSAYVTAIQSSLPLNFTTVIVSTTAPGPDDRDKVWIKVDGAGRILGTFLFSNGMWQTIFPFHPYIVPGEFRTYDPSLYTPAQTAAEPWVPCDGTVGATATPPVPNLQGLFPVGAGTRTLTSAQIAAGETATTFVSGTGGGAENNTIGLANMPPHNHTPVTTANPSASGFLTIGGGAGNLVGGSSYGSTPTTSTAGGQLNTTTGLYNAVPFKALPPYFPVAFMQWRPDLF